MFTTIAWCEPSTDGLLLDEMYGLCVCTGDKRGKRKRLNERKIKKDSDDIECNINVCPFIVTRCTKLHN